MTLEKTLKRLNSNTNYLNVAKELIYDKCSFDFLDLKQHLESVEYGACSFRLNEKSVQYRVSKITPTKTGQFVSIWKRNQEGITEPFDTSDELDFIIVTSKSADNLGQFIFPKSVLAYHGIISSKGKEGKRGIRVYPPWDGATNKQAEKTQRWQKDHFYSINDSNSADLDRIKKLITETN